MGFENFGLDYGNPDFVKYAESYGAKGYRLEKTADIEHLIEKCFQETGVHLIDIPIDYSTNHYILDKEIPEISRNL